MGSILFYTFFAKTNIKLMMLKEAGPVARWMASHSTTTRVLGIVIF